MKLRPLALSLFLPILFAFSACTAPHPSQKPKVIVSIPPLKFLVERIGGEHIETLVLVPPGASPHTYEPSPRQLLKASSSVLWIRIGEPFEKKVVNVFISHNHDMKIVDLREHIKLIPVQCCRHNHGLKDSDACDSHIWLSPKMLVQEINDIASSLVNLLPHHAEEFYLNSKKLIKEIEALDTQFTDSFSKPCPKTILVSHPAFGYFCRDYALEQLSIEVEGRDPTVKQLSELLISSRKKNISRIFIQEQYNTKGALLIAKELGAKTVILDPYAENVVENLQTIAAAFLQE